MLEGKTTDDKLFSGIFTWKMPVNMLCKKRQSSVVVNKFGRKNKWRNKWLCFLDFVFGQHRTYYSNIIEDQLKSISIFTVRYDSFCIALDFEINFLNFNSAFFTLNVGVKKTIFQFCLYIKVKYGKILPNILKNMVDIAKHETQKK